MNSIQVTELGAAHERLAEGHQTGEAELVLVGKVLGLGGIEGFEKLSGRVRTPLTDLARAAMPIRPAKDGQYRSTAPIPRRTMM